MFIEKSGRVRVKPYDSTSDHKNWKIVSRGSSGYGVGLKTRKEVDKELIKMVYSLS